MRSQSDGFRPIRQVGFAVSIGVPLMVVGLFLFLTAYTAGGTYLWVLAGSLFGIGLLAAISGRVV
jgi:hypothetical protein